MKNARKISLTVFFAAILIVTLTAMLAFAVSEQENAYAAEEIVYSVSDTVPTEYTVTYSDSIKLPIQVRNDTSSGTIYAITLKISYDKDLFGFDKAELSGEFSGGVNDNGKGTVTVSATTKGAEIATKRFVLTTIDFVLKAAPPKDTPYTFGFTKTTTSTTNGSSPSIQSRGEAFVINFREASGDATLKTFTVGNVLTSASFSPTTKDYGPFNVGYGVSQANFAYETNHSGAKVSVSAQNGSVSGSVFKFNAGTTATLSLTVTAENGSQEFYSCKITRDGGDTDNTLGAVVLKKGTRTINGVLNGTDVVFPETIAYADRTGWTLEINANKTTSVVKLGTQSGTNGKLTLSDRTWTGNPAQDRVSVTVTSQSGAVSEPYTVKVSCAAPSEVNRLSTLSVCLPSVNVNLIEFAPTTYRYTVYVPDDVNELNVAYTADEAITVSGDISETASINNRTELNIVATPQSGASTTYTIDIQRLNTDCTLSSLSVKNGNIELITAFDGETASYSVTVPYAVTSVAIGAELNDIDSTLTINGLAANQATLDNIALGSGNVITVVVSSQAGKRYDIDAYTKTYTVTVTRQEGSDNAKLEYLGLAYSDGTALEYDAADDVYTVKGDVSYDNHNDITLSVSAESALVSKINVTNVTGEHDFGDKTGQTSTWLLDLVSGQNEIAITVIAENGETEKTYKLIINVVQARSDTSLLADPIVCNGAEELHMLTIIPAKTYMVRYPADLTALTVVAIANDSSAQLSITAVSETNETPIGGMYYSSEEEITLTDMMTRFLVTVTAQSGDSKTYEILLSPYPVHVAEPGTPDEEKFITVDFGGMEIGNDGSETVGIDREEFETSYVVKKGTASAIFTVKIKGDATVSVLYGAVPNEEVEPQGLVAYAFEITQDGVLQKYKVDLVEGNNPIVFKVNETGIPGADEIYVLNIYRPVEQEKFNKAGWIAGIVVLAILLLAAIVILVLLLLGIIGGGKPNGDKDDKEEKTEDAPDASEPEEIVEPAAEEAAIEESAAVEKPETKETPAEASFTEETADKEPETDEASEAPIKEPVNEEPVKEENEGDKTEAVPAPAEAEKSSKQEPANEETGAEKPIFEETAATENVEEEVAAEAVIKEEQTEEPSTEKAEEAVESESEEEQDEDEELPDADGGTTTVVPEGYVVVPSEAVDENAIKIKNVLSLGEKYETLTREQKSFYDDLKIRAMCVPGAKLNTTKNYETVRVGQRRIIKLAIRREFVVACFYPENEIVSGLKKEFRGKDVRINTKETEIPIYDVNSYDAAVEMLQIIIEAIYKR